MIRNFRDDRERIGASKTNRFWPGLALAAAVLTVTAGCGYHLRGTGSSLPPSVKTMSIPVFRNLTTRYELDIKLTRAVIDEMIERGKVSVSAESATSDAVLEGEIVSFVATPVAFSGAAQADRYTITVTAKITLRERSSEKPLFSNPSFIYVEQYDVPQGRDFDSVQTEAIDKIAPKFARSLVAAILEGF